MKHYWRTLSIAGSDSGGGAGIQADLKTFSAFGCYGTTVITALTAQNTVGVHSIHPVPPDFIAQQLDAVLDDIGVDAVKVGMLHSTDVIRTVADAVRRYRPPYLVLDPVMVAKGGARLLEDSAVQSLRDELIPLSDVITPNVPEAAVLLNIAAAEAAADMRATARRLTELGPRAVLLKGGHLGGDRSPDYLFVRDTHAERKLDTARIATQNTHGTGCSLSSAIAAGLARGNGMESAIEHAKNYLTEAIRAGAEYRLGSGHGPVHHGYRFDPVHE